MILHLVYSHVELTKDFILFRNILQQFFNASSWLYLWGEQMDSLIYFIIRACYLMWGVNFCISTKSTFMTTLELYTSKKKYILHYNNSFAFLVYLLHVHMMSLTLFLLTLHRLKTDLKKVSQLIRRVIMTTGSLSTKWWLYFLHSVGYCKCHSRSCAC